MAVNMKLTLNIDEKVVREAKEYARGKQTSVSRLVEQYLRFVSLRESVAYDKTDKSLIDELTGVISLPADFDLKEMRTNYLLKKYDLKK